MSENHIYSWKINFQREHYFLQLLKLKKIMYPPKIQFLPLNIIFGHFNYVQLFLSVQHMFRVQLYYTKSLILAILTYNNDRYIGYVDSVSHIVAWIWEYYI